MASFKEQYLLGNVSIDELDDFVSNWHKNQQGLTLQNYLGFDDIEYAAFVRGESEIQKVLENQKKKAASVLKALAKIIK